MPILDGGIDDSTIGIESTIIKIDESTKGMVSLTILRSGTIDMEDITKALDEARIGVPYNVSAKSNKTSGSPGKEQIYGYATSSIKLDIS
jgi:hypothetical protein